jgi:hypothetical protein
VVSLRRSYEVHPHRFRRSPYAYVHDGEEQHWTRLLHGVVSSGEWLLTALVRCCTESDLNKGELFDMRLSSLLMAGSESPPSGFARVQSPESRVHNGVGCGVKPQMEGQSTM